MPRRPVAEEEDDEDAAAAAPAEPAEEEQVEEEEEVPPDFQSILEAEVPLLSWFSLAGAQALFRTSPDVRKLLSALVSARVTFEVIAAVSASPRLTAERQRRVQRARAQAPRFPAHKLVLFVQCPLKEVPLRRSALNRALGRAIPMIKWEDIKRLNVRCRDDLDTMDRACFTCVQALERKDALQFLSDWEWFKHVTKLTLTVPQLISLPPDWSAPQITRLKLTCQDIAFSAQVLQTLGTAFPNLDRLHLNMLPIGLLPLCGPGFMAPRDLRLTLDTSFGASERSSNVFVASHLLSLPFSWGDSLLRNVVRLQVSELNEKHGGLALEEFSSVLRALPLLRRLGTVSSQTAKLLDIVGDDCRLEEVVVVTEVDELSKLFKIFVPLEQQKRRMALKRLRIHLLASDGVSSLKDWMENAIAGGWLNIASTMLHPDDGSLVFSVASQHLMESANVQLAWYYPQYFGLDAVIYDNGQLPVSTPAELALPRWDVEGIPRPNGTLITGPLRPTVASAHLDDTGGERGMSPPVSAQRRNTKTRKSLAASMHSGPIFHLESESLVDVIGLID
eukprot:TRINITY_DN18379_c0_g1_i1.p1 TRINITY_DN18379_c0_g1~~TRINITY_DN18379_c0_g1_i1.p1  ORF type:complete len:562 (-),score=137.08 TRINITY_DN18379_c0_g1_i1:292-1977(-)